jgi:tetratricopeptide (TPR) repeat protein
VALATLEYNRANWPQAEKYAENALKRAHQLNKNPKSGEASHLLASAQEKQGKLKEAYDNYFKSSWSGDCRDTAFYHLARLALMAGDTAKALGFCQQSLRFNGCNNLAMALYGLLLAKRGNPAAALAYIDARLVEYPLSYALHYARYAVADDERALEALIDITNNRGINSSVLAAWLTTLGMKAEALTLLTRLDNQEAMPLLWRAALTPDTREKSRLVAEAQRNFALRVRFPNLVEEVDMLRSLGDDGFARYLLGCFCYSKKSYGDAVACWSFTLQQMPDFAPAHRLMGIWAWNKRGDFAQAEKSLQRAIALEPGNARLLFERDYLYKINGKSPAFRLAALADKVDVALMRDDLTAELLNLWNITGQTGLAAQILAGRTFHPWEGGEGKVTGQYLINQQRRAIAAIDQGQLEEARELLRAALTYPLNLGEGRLAGQSDNDIWYLLGLCAERQGESEQAQAAYREAAKGGSSLDAGRYYNDQPVDYLFYQALAFNRTGQAEKAAEMFKGFIAWASAHRDDPVQSDFFAVSLPDLVALEGDARSAHLQHCLFVSALGHLGLGEVDKFKQIVSELLDINPLARQGALNPPGLRGRTLSLRK